MGGQKSGKRSEWHRYAATASALVCCTITDGGGGTGGGMWGPEGGGAVQDGLAAPRLAAALTLALLRGLVKLMSDPTIICERQSSKIRRDGRDK